MRPAPISATRRFLIEAMFSLGLKARNNELIGIGFLYEIFFIEEKSFPRFKSQNVGARLFKRLECSCPYNGNIKAEILVGPCHLDHDTVFACHLAGPADRSVSSFHGFNS